MIVANVRSATIDADGDAVVVGDDDDDDAGEFGRSNDCQAIESFDIGHIGPLSRKSRPKNDRKQGTIRRRSNGPDGGQSAHDRRSAWPATCAVRATRTHLAARVHL